MEIENKFYWDESTIQYMCEVQYLNGWTSMLESITTHVQTSCLPEDEEKELDLILDLFKQCEEKINKETYI